MPIDPAATYLLVGGMGGVGRVLANWLVSVGAKNIAFISRSAATSPDNQDYLRHLRDDAGINAKAWNCDATDKAGLKKVLSDVQLVMPQIKGTIIASMVLRVRLCHLVCGLWIGPGLTRHCRTLTLNE